ncbi:MAG: CPBP family glutamic-type intramembrane protease [Planctomycetia bacterium]|nr:CPBP family glutamic-type intramembrane protease [Planctomycetia bacterium]
MNFATFAPNLEMLLVTILLAGTVVAWGFLFSRLALRLPILPKQNILCRARWNGRFVFAILALFVVLPAIFTSCLIAFFPPSSMDSLQTTGSGISTSHPIETFLKAPGPDGASAPSVLKCVVMLLYAAALVPIVEEFVFRVVVQGWLDARERELFPKERQPGILAFFAVAVGFAFLHFRSGTQGTPSQYMLTMSFSGSALGSVLLLAVSIYSLRALQGRSWREFGFDFRFWQSDLLLGAWGFFLAYMPSILVQGWLTSCFGDRFAADPFTLIIIALVFGTLYMRTRRILPGLVAHAMLNATAILGLIIASG